jgi:sigma-B regulation protein RsbU (phosphoserine phosphatase)
MSIRIEDTLRNELLDRRLKLQGPAGNCCPPADVSRLMEQVDAALARMDQNTYGLCEVCNEPVESDRLLADPLERFCLDHLPPAEARALEADIALASQVQRRLLPPSDFAVPGWDVTYHYEPHGAVSGDYCDLIHAPDGGFTFILGDVSGKGIAASMLMSHLHAIFRTLAPQDLPLGGMVRQAGRLFCQVTLPMHYATLVCGRIRPDGSAALCNAGHPPVLVRLGGKVSSLEATGMPLGVFCEESAMVQTVNLSPGDVVVAYTDGLSEALDPSEREFGRTPVETLLAKSADQSSADVMKRILAAWHWHRAGLPQADDLAVMILRRLP